VRYCLTRVNACFFLLIFDLASLSACITDLCADNLYFKKVIKNLNIEDVAQQEVNNTHKQDGASSERGPEKEDVLDDFIHEEDDSNWLDEEPSIQMPDVQDEHASGNDDDDGDLDDIFDWY